MAAYVMYGFDSAAELSEETRDPRRTAPKAIVTRCWCRSSAAADDPRGADVGARQLGDDLSTGAWPGSSRASSTPGWARPCWRWSPSRCSRRRWPSRRRPSRVMFSMARDNRLPFGKSLARVNKRTGTPVITGIAVGMLAIRVLLVNLGQSSVFAAVASVSVVIVYLAYLFVTISPCCGTGSAVTPRTRPSLRTLPSGRWGLPVNIVAVVFGIFLLINVGWPRAAVYDPAGGAGYSSTRRRCRWCRDRPGHRCLRRHAPSARPPPTRPPRWCQLPCRPSPDLGAGAAEFWAGSPGRPRRGTPGLQWCWRNDGGTARR